MALQLPRHKFTADEYEQLGRVGIFTEDDRVELIEGEIIEMSPIGRRHMACVDRATDVFTSCLKGKALISVQNPLRLNNYNEPQPDIVVLKPRADYYASKSHTPEDTFLVLEVSDTSLGYDINVKLPIYAAAGIAEVWIENLREDLLLVCRDPAGRGYSAQLTLRRGDSISPVAFPIVVLKLEDLLG